MNKIILFFFITILFTACAETCYNPPQPIVFEFVDSNNENLITNGTLTNFSVKEENQTQIQLTKTSDDRILLENVGAYNGTKNYFFDSNLKNFEFSIESSEFNSGCDGYQINKLTFTGIAIDVEDENGHYKIVFQ